MDEGVPIIKRSNIEDRFLVKSSLNMAVTDRYISNAWGSAGTSQLRSDRATGGMNRVSGNVRSPCVSGGGVR